MPPLEDFIDEREERARSSDDQRRRDASALNWLQAGLPPEVRLPRFDAWLREELGKRLNWNWAGKARDKRLEQCRFVVGKMVLELWRRGWMLDGRRLAAHIVRMLDSVAAEQRAGRVREFWPYFNAVARRYVGYNAEEIREEAMSIGASTGDVFSVLKKTIATLPESYAQRTDETIREKIRRASRVSDSQPDDGQLRLL